MYGNITIEDLHHDDYQSSARNKLIVEAFYLTGDIEKYGTGYRRVRKAINAYPSMKFDYKEIQGGFLVELSYEKQKDILKTPESVEKSVEKIIILIKENPYITQKDIAKEMGLSRRGIEKNISILKEKGIILRIGPDKGGYWQVKK